jgi:hypothetical protein
MSILQLKFSCNMEMCPLIIAAVTSGHMYRSSLDVSLPAQQNHFTFRVCFPGGAGPVGNCVQAERGGQCGPGEICKEGQCQDSGAEPQGGKDGQRGAHQVSTTEAERNGTWSRILLAGGFRAAGAHQEILLHTVMLPVQSVCSAIYLASQSDFEMEATE